MTGGQGMTDGQWMTGDDRWTVDDRWQGMTGGQLILLYTYITM